ncbi:MAG: trigger factor [Flavobacteriaceae bacterium]|jgi:trigger factor|nr:trigger factor [Flavobacteriaceae bacterium]MBT4113083.1 trigger factor [Flavobacteriaceae bacterium]MBT4613926.1 trigger factor [Flavobacteriaceae bacterium]MBT5246112.1 trigger factor [Flavobacteriaceae bacterium]MBT5650621.1 trigger factor [Flavobacteriaceae bacterium]
MNITSNYIDKLNGKITIEVDKKDYTKQVNTVLQKYSQTANVPGFRKGHVPMGLIKKQYGKAVIMDEVNKLIDKELRGYIKDKEIDMLGGPIPVPQDNINWDSDKITFEFEVGLTPKFDVKLKFKKPIINYIVKADEKMINEQLSSIQKQYGKLTIKKKIEKDCDITGVFTYEDEINNKSTFNLNRIKEKTVIKKLLGLKVGESVTLGTKDLFDDHHELIRLLNISHDRAKDIDIEVKLNIEEINYKESADLDQELFDKTYGKDIIKSVTELKDKISHDIEKQFINQTDQKLMNDVIEYLIENTKFKLPSEFLTKWIKINSEKKINDEEAKEEYEKSEKGMKYQLIESKLVTDNNLQVNFEDLKSYAGDLVKAQMNQHGQSNPSDKELDDIVARVLQNKEEIKRLTEQLTSNRILTFFKENSNIKTKELSYEKFIKEAYSS